MKKTVLVNRKGFTLVELLAVLVILSAIMAIVIPSLSSSMERAKNKKMESNKKLLISAAEMYVSDHRYSIDNNSSSCYISLGILVDGGYITNDIIYSDDGNLTGVILYTKSGNKYEYIDEYNEYGAC